MNINMLMQQAQRMQQEVQERMKKTKDELALVEVQSEAGGGLVKVTMTANKVIKRIQLSEELLKDDVEIAEDLIAAAVNDAIRQAEKVSEDKMAGATEGLGLPPGLANMF